MLIYCCGELAIILGSQPKVGRSILLNSNLSCHGELAIILGFQPKVGRSILPDSNIIAG